MSLPTLLCRSALALTLGLGLMAPGLAAAQDDAPHEDAVRERDPRGPGGRGRHHQRHHHRKRVFKRMMSELDLTDNQRLQIRTIVETARERRREIREQGRSEQTRKQMHELRRETRDLIRDVLTDEQRAELAELRERHHQRRLDRRMQKVTRHLELSDGQARQIRQIFEEAHEKKSQLRDGDRQPEARREAIRELFEQTRGEVREVLNEEQREKMDRFLERRKRHHRGGPRGPRGR